MPSLCVPYSSTGTKGSRRAGEGSGTTVYHYPGNETFADDVDPRLDLTSTSCLLLWTTMDKPTPLYPGGPDRPDDSQRPATVRTGEEYEARRMTRGAARTRRRRSLRVKLGLAFVLVLSWVVGYAIGVQSHRTPEEIARAMTESNSAQSPLERERDNILAELWRMEMVEAQRNSR